MPLTIADHASQQTTIAAEHAAGTSRLGILAILTTSHGAVAARAALRFWDDQRRHRIPSPADLLAREAARPTLVDWDFRDCDDSGARLHVIETRVADACAAEAGR